MYTVKVYYWSRVGKQVFHQLDCLLIMFKMHLIIQQDQHNKDPLQDVMTKRKTLLWFAWTVWTMWSL